MAELISVHAQFPKNIVPDTDLDLDPTNWEWKQFLAFPVSRLNNLQFSSKPYKCIRYTAGIVIGARGHLCTERDTPNPVPIDYDSGLSGVSIDFYYHTTDQEKRRMFPLDPKLADNKTVTVMLHTFFPTARATRYETPVRHYPRLRFIGGSILRRSPYTDVETPVVMMTPFETSTTFAMVCSSK